MDLQWTATDLAFRDDVRLPGRKADAGTTAGGSAHDERLRRPRGEHGMADLVIDGLRLPARALLGAARGRRGRRWHRRAMRARRQSARKRWDACGKC